MKFEMLENGIREAVKTRGYDIVEIQIERLQKTEIIKIFIDKENGVTVDDCTVVSRLVNDELFKADYGSRDYRLEVSSPGIDRPLVNYKDFNRNISRRVYVAYQENGKTAEREGKLVSADEHCLVIQGRHETYTVPMKSVVKGKVVLPW